MIRIIAEGVYDTAHSIYEAHEILKEKPDAVFFELPDIPFQEIFDMYSQGKIDVKQLKKLLFMAIRKEEKEVDHELLNKFLVGEIEGEELEDIETEGREIHVMQVTKKVGAKMFAMDYSLGKIEALLSREVAEEHMQNVKEVIRSKKLPFIVWELFEIFHYPFYVVERILHHEALRTVNPFIHNVNHCKICKWGTKWDRWVNRLMIPIFDKMPLSKELKADIKIAYVMRKVDYLREEHMAKVIAEKYYELQKKLGREPKIVVIVHLWCAYELERILEGLE